MKNISTYNGENSQILKFLSSVNCSKFVDIDFDFFVMLVLSKLMMKIQVIHSTFETLCHLPFWIITFKIIKFNKKLQIPI